MLAFHSLTSGCDTFSTFCGIDDECHAVLQRFVILLYDRASDFQNINDCRRVLFTRKNRAIENIPPTADALAQHIKRATLQASIWNNSLDSQYVIPSPTNWGWTVTSDGSYRSVWTITPEVAKHCVQLTTCTCRKRCTSCKCIKMEIRCKKFSVCEGQCSDSDR
ncbi:unnamed protein product [Phaedon cochleariae]|uniref:Uncharacterized protein n=1 Tax=Phaedon cochleariae TaxID=80249 RepID=A0A9N9X3W4_PHACE|nr:unnamed protein product [Phaedon cochleariae]